MTSPKGGRTLEQLRESLVRAMESDLQISAPYRTIREHAEAEVAAFEAALRVVPPEEVEELIANLNATIHYWFDEYVAALRASGAGTRQGNADTLHWLRGELCDLLDMTVGDDQYPWKAILEKLKTRLAESRPN